MIDLRFSSKVYRGNSCLFINLFDRLDENGTNAIGLRNGQKKARPRRVAPIQLLIALEILELIHGVVSTGCFQC